MISVFTKDYTDNDILIVIKALTDINNTAAKYNLPAPSHSLYADAYRASHYLVRKLSEHCENIHKGDIVK